MKIFKKTIALVLSITVCMGITEQFMPYISAENISDISEYNVNDYDFDTLLKMDENDLIKYCEQYGLEYISAEEAANNIKFSNVLSAMMTVDSYIKDGKEDITVSSDISDIDQHNIADYDFEKMVSALDLPDKYYDVNPDMSSLAIFQDSKEIPDSDEREMFFVKLARISIKVKADLIDSENDVRLYQLAMIWASKCSDVYNFSVQFLGGNDSNDNNEDIFPKTAAEYETFIKKYGNVSVHGKYIVYCGEINYSTGAKLIVEQSGTAEIKEYKNYTISESAAGVGGGSEKSVYIYEAITSGAVKVSFTAGRVWDTDADNAQNFVGYYEIDNDLNISQTSEISDVIKGDVNGDGGFNVADVVTLQKWLLAVPDVELKNWKAADLCEDDKLNVIDLCLMKEELVKTMNNTYTVEDPEVID